MSTKRNVLFIMCDQLRFDYLGCSGHPFLKTPNIDRLAQRGVRFRNAYVQSTICGPSRMCVYTGRYVRSHGSSWNGVPLRVGEPTLGDHLKEIGVRNVLVGKTHMVPDREGMARLGIAPESMIGVHVAQCGFEPFERDDGLHPDGPYDPDPAYDDYLRRQGFEADNPWEAWANSAEGDDGELLSGWLLAHADKPARVPEEHSETPYMTRRAIDFIDSAAKDGRPWCLHLSYIKPHWPYIVAAPYHDLYGAADVIPVIRSERERQNPHRVFGAFQNERVAQAFARDGVRQRVIPAYMGLIAQIDDQLGLLFAALEERGLTDDTLIVFTSDHGDYLGDHWLGEKQLFHDVSAKVPLIVVDPSREADATRGTTSDALVELIDLAPTFLDYLGGRPKPHVLEGRSLLPLLHGPAPADWRGYAFSEYDYAFDRIRLALDTPVSGCRLTMVTDGRFKAVFAEGFRPMLYDLLRDPDEFVDLGDDPNYADVRSRLSDAFFTWTRNPRNRITRSDEAVAAKDDAQRHYDRNIESGILIGYWDEADLAAERSLREAYLKSRS
ncbi:alkaline phosphatase family protein [Bradyrhizobium sp. SZCCHNPS2010]|uniref:alkaline phosphatase family protein n=1 Tax=Bradyrhizobium sp. SZCCHNPS2010 TaxID=3057333 RepID=UPI0029164B47|nr:alkaline phosphatase family protein [Bradyrhizobium sp. SZCCHNPS2010]